MGHKLHSTLLVARRSDIISLKIKGIILEMLKIFKEFLSKYGKHDAIAESSDKQTQSKFSLVLILKILLLSGR